MPLSASNVNVKPLLSGYAQDYAATMQSLVSRKLFPTFAVPKQDAKYPMFGKENLYLPDDNIASYDGRAKEATRSADLVDIHCIAHALKEGVDVHANQNREGPFQIAERNAVANITAKLMMREEKRVRDLCFNHSSTNGSALSGTGALATNKWSGTGGDPLTVRKNAASNMWVEPNTMVIGYDVYLALKSNPKVLEKLSNAATKIVNKQLLQDIFEVENILIADMRTAGEKPVKGTPTITRTWGGLCAFAYVSDIYGEPAAGRIFVEHQADTDTEGFYVTNWFEPDNGVKGKEQYKVALVSLEKIVCADCLYVIKDCV